MVDFLDSAPTGKKKKIALIRMDRMGDLMCTLPVDQNFHTSERFEFTWIISPNLGFILENTEPERNFKEWEQKFSWRSFKNFVNFCKQFDAAIVFQAPTWVTIALWWARVPHRFGPRSKWHQLLFLNHSLRQKRSNSVKHEADYNMDLFTWAISKHVNTTPFVRFRDLHLTHAPVSSILQKPYVVVHPGMGGSALNWPQAHYIELMRLLLKKGYLVVITGTESDMRWLTEIAGIAQNEKNVCWLVGKLNGIELLAVLGRAKAVVAPSTGVAHLAAACGVKTLGLYSPIKVQSATRWAPRGPYAQTLSPNLTCPSKNKCIKESCDNYPCLTSIKPTDVIEALSLPNYERGLDENSGSNY
jgi:ADP-heptose:LPS heptosyltransferase